MGHLLYIVGFLVVAGEWFAMWQSKIWNGQATADLHPDHRPDAPAPLRAGAGLATVNFLGALLS